MKQTRFIRTTPHLPVTNLAQTIDYYLNTLGFTDHWTFGDKDGGVSKNDLKLLFAEDADFVAEINTNKHRLPLLWFVENIDDIYLEFQNRDITISDTLKTHSYGLKEFAFIDINGYYIRIAEGVDQ